MLLLGPKIVNGRNYDYNEKELFRKNSLQIYIYIYFQLWIEHEIQPLEVGYHLL